MEIVVIIGIIIVLAIANTLYQRQRERNLIQRIKQSGNNPAVALSELDREIATDRASAEFWKKQSGRPI